MGEMCRMIRPRRKAGMEKVTDEPYHAGAIIE
jgi:hypothetical protein